ncbi:Protein NSP-INTERACTING KINASE 2 [Glycine soja]
MALPIPNYTLVGALHCILIVSWTCLSIATANGITGNIPYGLGILSKLTYLDLSSNDIKGTISRRFIDFTSHLYSNSRITPFPSCYSSPHRPNNIDLDLVVVMKIFLPPTPLLALLCSAYVFHRCCKAGNCMSISKETKNGDMFSIWNYDDIIEATENFDIIYCIGAGGYGSVYKAQLPSGRVVALKKLQNL